VDILPHTGTWIVTPKGPSGVTDDVTPQSVHLRWAKDPSLAGYPSPLGVSYRSPILSRLAPQEWDTTGEGSSV